MERSRVVVDLEWRDPGLWWTGEIQGCGGLRMKRSRVVVDLEWRDPGLWWT
jgi:hypothetical protein